MRQLMEEAELLQLAVRVKQVRYSAPCGQSLCAQARCRHRAVTAIILLAWS